MDRLGVVVVEVIMNKFAGMATETGDVRSGWHTCAKAGLTEKKVVTPSVDRLITMNKKARNRFTAPLPGFCRMSLSWRAMRWDHEP